MDIMLKCENCNGNVRVEKEKEDLFVVIGDNYMFIGGTGANDERFVCEHCGTEFIRTETYEKSGNITVGKGSVYLGKGSVVGGSIITGNVVSYGGNFVGGKRK